MKRVLSANRLLAGLPRSDYQRLFSRCEEIELVFGEVLCAPGERIRHIYFPTAGVISLMVAVDDHENLEVERIGTEGMFGIPAFLNVHVSALHAQVRGSGSVLRLSSAAFRRELKASSALQRTMNMYVYVSLAQLARTVACESFHPLQARLARWLLMSHDRTSSDDFRITHEHLGKLLGVRRVGITSAAGVLQKSKLISYRRGHITILNRLELERASCSCYRESQDLYDRTFNQKSLRPHAPRAAPRTEASVERKA